MKPIIPLDFFDPLTTLEGDQLSATMELERGFAFGMVIRRGISDLISFETGINQTRRRFAYSMTNDTANYTASGIVRFTGYEIPVMALIYIRLGERTYMNNALGFSLDAYPSEAVDVEGKVRAALVRRNWAQIGVVGNIGVEYRTESSGYFYLGATYHRPFNSMAIAEMAYFDLGIPYKLFGNVSGSYLTVDLRYFFHEDPDRLKMRRKK